MVKPTNRPDYKFWMTPWEDRKSVTKEDYSKIMEELKKYSYARFSMGRRLKLIKPYNNIPIGTRCTVISIWPYTSIRWDKWSKQGFGSSRNYILDVLFKLDMCLDYV